MTYLLAVNSMLLLGVAFGFGHLVQWWRRKPGHQQALLKFSEVMAPGILFGMPLLMEMANDRGGRLSGAAEGAAYLPAVISAAGAVVGLVVYGSRLYRQLQPATLDWWSRVPTALGVLLSVYMLVVVMDHVTFYAGGGDVLTLKLDDVRRAGQLTELSCEGDILVVRAGLDGGAATYRCPTGVVLGKFSARPFVPWPGFVEGKPPRTQNF